MLYIKQEARKDLDAPVYTLIRLIDKDYHAPGNLTYVLTKLLLGFLGEQYTFADIAETLGALEATKLELYRRTVAPYENEKIKQNGDVF